LPVFMQVSRQGQSLFLSQHGNDQVGGAAYCFVPAAEEGALVTVAAVPYASCETGAATAAQIPHSCCAIR